MIAQDKWAQDPCQSKAARGRDHDLFLVREKKSPIAPKPGGSGGACVAAASASSAAAAGAPLPRPLDGLPHPHRLARVADGLAAAELGDVEEAVDAGGELDEGAEGREAREAAGAGGAGG